MPIPILLIGLFLLFYYTRGKKFDMKATALDNRISIFIFPFVPKREFIGHYLILSAYFTFSTAIMLILYKFVPDKSIPFITVSLLLFLFLHLLLKYKLELYALVTFILFLVWWPLLNTWPALNLPKSFSLFNITGMYVPISYGLLILFSYFVSRIYLRLSHGKVGYITSIISFIAFFFIYVFMDDLLYSVRFVYKSPTRIGYALILLFFVICAYLLNYIIHNKLIPKWEWLYYIVVLLFLTVIFMYPVFIPIWSLIHLRDTSIGLVLRFVIVFLQFWHVSLIILYGLYRRSTFLTNMGIGLLVLVTLNRYFSLFSMRNPALSLLGLGMLFILLGYFIRRTKSFIVHNDILGDPDKIS